MRIEGASPKMNRSRAANTGLAHYEPKVLRLGSPIQGVSGGGSYRRGQAGRLRARGPLVLRHEARPGGMLLIHRRVGCGRNVLATVRQRTYHSLALPRSPGACYELLRGL